MGVYNLVSCPSSVFSIQLLTVTHKRMKRREMLLICVYILSFMGDYGEIQQKIQLKRHERMRTCFICLLVVTSCPFTHGGPSSSKSIAGNYRQQLGTHKQLNKYWLLILTTDPLWILCTSLKLTFVIRSLCNFQHCICDSWSLNAIQWVPHFC